VDVGMPTVMSPDQRRSILAGAIQEELARGGRLQSQTDFSAVVVHGKPVNHVLHLLLSVLLIGLWLIVWLLLALTGGEKRVMLTVDEYGRIQRRGI
jgi:hypothetical protein